MKTMYFKDLDININSGELVSIIGPNGSGKSRILKKICGKVLNNDIFIDDKNINDYSLSYKRNNIVTILDDNRYSTPYVKSELEYYLKLLNYTEEDIKKRTKEFIDYFKLENIYYKKFEDTNIEDKIYIKILSFLIIIPTIICIDDLLTYLNKDKKIKILNYIKEKNITLISITSDIEEILLFDKVLIMNKGKKDKYDDLNNILLDELNFKNNDLDMPFIYELNNLLKSYDLIDENHIVYKELIDILWN